VEPTYGGVCTLNKRYNWINFATLITISRIPLLVAAYFVYVNIGVWQGVVTLMVAASTDFWDGWVARKFNYVTNVGRMLDPVFDKIFMIGSLVFAVTVIDGQYQSMAIRLVLAVEVFLTLITIFQVAQGKPVPTVVKAGKWGMFMRMTAVISLFLAPGLPGVFGVAFTVLGCSTAVIGAALGLIASRSYIREVRAGAPDQHS